MLKDLLRITKELTYRADIRFLSVQKAYRLPAEDVTLQRLLSELHSLHSHQESQGDMNEDSRLCLHTIRTVDRLLIIRIYRGVTDCAQFNLETDQLHKLFVD